MAATATIFACHQANNLTIRNMHIVDHVNMHFEKNDDDGAKLTH